MAHIIGEFPVFAGFIRREYTRDRQDGYDDYLPCEVFGIRCVRGFSLQFLCRLGEPNGGALFLAPIEAFCWKRPDCPRVKGEPVDMAYIQPWDCFGYDFGIHEFSLLRRIRCLVLPDRRPARYRFTIDFAVSDLAEFNEQHKFLHVVFMEDGSVGAFPNNRVLMADPAFAPVATEKPDFLALSGEFLAE